MAGGGDDGSWVELRCDPAPFSCHADVERMLLDAQLEPDGADGWALPARGSPARDEESAAKVSERLPPPPGRPQTPPGREEAPKSRPEPSAPRDAPQDAERTERRPPAALSRSCARCPEHRCAKDHLPFACPTPPVRWALRDGAVLRKKRLFGSELLLLVIPPLLLSHALTLGLGIYIGKRLAASSANPL
ncbi:BCL2/adenovirus E1B 19 kDa protein-interacting protein 3-like [Tympanuchus pallidicinctus]|uniref:BCL2/adenovirus E1B 19 kDa protein-interacting protein 3-like n=1 Tax=Tympanuchus pallidicinctus TaxID=109042 RepID=UPI0022874B21|nr:BCL2/adenovirus E1B 19 kDa protein-interacting protein 3-like [Tympanuchus pallidicinctus]